MKSLSHLAPAFLKPRNPKHRQYEALRSLCVEELSLADAAKRSGYSVAYLRYILLQFERHPDRNFFLPSTPGRKPGQKTPDALKRDQLILDLRREEQLSVLEISATLSQQGFHASKSVVARVLRNHGFPKLRRRPPDHRRPRQEAAADCRLLDLSPRRFQTRYGGLFLFARLLASMPLRDILTLAQWPASTRLPALQAVLSLLALKLYGTARLSHVQPEVCDPGLALFAGLNVIPKRSTLTEYSCRVDPRHLQGLARLWIEAVHAQGLPQGTSFDLDFHTIPFHGHEALVEKHYVSKRSRTQKGLLALVARDADARILCYASAELSKADRHIAPLQFADWWRERTGQEPLELIFDSTFTTRASLCKLHARKIGFITLRRRTKQVLAQVAAAQSSAWRQVELRNVGRRYRRPLTLDQRITLAGFPGKIRQIAITNIGHQRPILLLTNQSQPSVSALVDRYARRMLIENAIEEAIDFFHMDALSSKVPQKIGVDLQVTLMASSLYRLLGHKLGAPYSEAKARTLFRKFVHASGRVDIQSDRIEVRIGRRAYNPALMQAGFADDAVKIPWLNNLPLQIRFL